MPDLLKPAEAAVALRVDKRTLRRWAAAGLVASYRTPSGLPRYRVGDIEACLQLRDVAVGPTPAPGVERRAVSPVTRRLLADGAPRVFDLSPAALAALRAGAVTP